MTRDALRRRQARAQRARDLGPARDQADVRARARERLERARRGAARAHHHDDAAGARRRPDRRAPRAGRRRRCSRRGLPPPGSNSSVFAAPDTRASGPCVPAMANGGRLVRDRDVEVAVALRAQVGDERVEPPRLDGDRVVLAVDAERAEGGVVDRGRAALADVGAEHGRADHFLCVLVDGRVDAAVAARGR